MTHSPRSAIALFFALVLLLFHLGLTSGSGMARTSKPETSGDPKKSSETGTPLYSKDLLYRLKDEPLVRMGRSSKHQPTELKTEGLFILRRTTDSAAPANHQFDELLLFDLQGESISYPAASARGTPEPEKSLRF